MPSPTDPDTSSSAQIAQNDPAGEAGEATWPCMPALDTHPFLDQLAERVVIFDGAMGTALQQEELTAADFGGEALEGCNEIIVRTRPDVVDRIHRRMLDVGVNALQTNTFGSAPWVLDEYGLADETETLNRRAAELARTAADAFATADDPRWVVGSIGPGTRAPTLSLGKDPATTRDFIDVATMEHGYRRQVRGLLDGGSDVLLIETCYDLLQIKAAVAACNDVFVERGQRVPLMVQFTVEKDINTMLLGTEPLAAIAALDPLPIDVLGMNCATGPDDMREHVRALSRQSRLPISVIPNAGIPYLENGCTVYPLDPAALAAAHVEFVDNFGVAIVGGCCGTTVEHMAAVVDAVGTHRPRPRVVDDALWVRPSAAGRLVAPGSIVAGQAAPTSASGTPPTSTATSVSPTQARSDSSPSPITIEWRPSLASLYSAVTITQDTAFLAIGERVNANGSKVFRDLLLAEDWDAAVQLAKSQTREGAHVLDVCVDYVGRDGVADIIQVVDRFATQSTLPLVIDSTETAVIEAALVRLGGRAVINSVNLEDGRRKADVLLPLARRYGAAVVVLAIDERGQARTADWKVEVCERVAEIAINEYGLEAHDLIFDCLTFPLGSGQEDLRGDALATLEAIERVTQRIPGCGTTLGVSNVSFGLSPAARHVLNSVFLKEAIDRGLTSAIVHPARILPLHRIPDEQVTVALDLIHDRRGSRGMNGTAESDYDPLHRFMALFDGVRATSASIEDRSAMPVEERLERRIVDGDKDGIETDLDEALQAHPPLAIINQFLLAGMARVGELFASGAMQLPFVLQSAEAMKTAVAHLEPHIAADDSAGVSAKGRVVLATVKGDVHDIGKNLVDIILRNNGYEVINLGIKQPIDAILQVADDKDCDAIGMSGLLVKSTVIMRENLEEMNARGVSHYPVLLGGAALTRGYVEDDLRALYDGSVFYCKDAFEGLRVLDAIQQARASGDDAPIELAERKPRRATRPASKPADPPSFDAKGRPRSAVARDIDIPPVPFWGSRVVRGITVDDIAPMINEVALFRNQWGFTPPPDGTPDDYRQLLDEVARPALRDWVARAKTDKVVTPAVVYGYWPANGDGDDLVIWDPQAPMERELSRLTFPRQDRGRFLCIADFFRSIDEGTPDVLSAQLVTMGRTISQVAAQLFADDRYQDYLYAHGFGVEMAEALAEYWHQRIRDELGIADHDGPTVQDLFRQGYRGSRYSFGYAACPRLEDQQVLFDLLEPERIDVALTDEFMLDPEQSTSAIIVHHPEAKYFNAR